MLCMNTEKKLRTISKFRTNKEMKETYLDLCSVALNVGIGHSSFLQSSKRVVLGPPFFVFIVTIT